MTHPSKGSGHHGLGVAMVGQAHGRDVLGPGSLLQLPTALVLLDVVRLLPGLRVLEIGDGTLVSALEARLGGQGTLHVQKDALNGPLPLAAGAVDVVLANLVAQGEPWLSMAAQLLPVFGQCAFTALLPGANPLIRTYLEGLLEERGEADRVPTLRSALDHDCPSQAWWQAALEQAGFLVRQLRVETLRVSFLNGRALLAHPEVRARFLPSWMAAAPERNPGHFEHFLTGRLDRLALERGGLRLEVPYLCVDAVRGT